MPDTPDRSDQPPRSEWRHMALKDRLRYAAPAELLDRPEKGHHEQCCDHRPDTFGGGHKRKQGATLQQRPRQKGIQSREPSEIGDQNEGRYRWRSGRHEKERMRSAGFAKGPGRSFGCQNATPTSPHVIANLSGKKEKQTTMEYRPPVEGSNPLRLSHQCLKRL